MESAVETLDLHKLQPPDALREALETYNKLQRGEEIAIVVGSYTSGLQMGLVEAGVKHRLHQEEGGYRLILCGASQSLSGAPGIHHVVAGRNGDVWTCQRARRVARIDGHHRVLVAARDVATKASHIALDEARDRLFIADSGGNALLCVRASDLAPVGCWQVPGSPQLPLVTTEGIACITGGAAGVLGIVWPSSGGFRSKVIEVGTGPHDPIASPDGQSVLVPCAGDGEIVRVRLSDGVVTGRFAVGEGPAHLAVHPDGSRIYVANTFDGTLACISPDGALHARVESGQWAHVPEVTPNGQLVYVANFFDDTLSVFDALTLKRLTTCHTDAYPHGLNIASDGKKVVATGFSGDSVTVFDGATGRECAHIKVGEGSAHTAFLPKGRTAFVGCSISDHVAVIDLDAGQCLGTIKLN